MTTMKSARIVRFRWLLVAMALLVLPLWGCSDAGDSPAGPGDGGQNGDTGESSITATVSNAEPGGVTEIVGYYRDANGDVVAGVEIIASSEGDASYYDLNGNWFPFFSFLTNPTLTGADGVFSIGVYVDNLVPADSYTLVVQTSPGFSGPYTVAYLSLKVQGLGSEDIVTPSAPTGNTTPTADVSTSYIAKGSESSFGHGLQYSFSWGDGTVTEWVNADTANESSAAHAYDPGACVVSGTAVSATYEITTKARCADHTEYVSESSPALKVTVTRNCP